MANDEIIWYIMLYNVNVICLDASSYSSGKIPRRFQASPVTWSLLYFWSLSQVIFPVRHACNSSWGRCPGAVWYSASCSSTFISIGVDRNVNCPINRKPFSCLPQSVSLWGLKSPSRVLGSPGQSSFQHSSQGLQKGQALNCGLARKRKQWQTSNKLTILSFSLFSLFLYCDCCLFLRWGSLQKQGIVVSLFSSC